MKSRGLFVGINYFGDSAALRGCANDVANIRGFLSEKNVIAREDGIVLCDDPSLAAESDGLPTGQRIVQELHALALASHAMELELAWFHFSGHGCQLASDWSGDEEDGKDECLVPLDYRTGGVITDDTIRRILTRFNPHTRVIIVLDCCHNGTGADLKYKFLCSDEESIPTKCSIANPDAPCAARIISLSGSMDSQTSADAYSVMGMRKFTGAMTSCLLLALKEMGIQANVFDILRKVRQTLKTKGFSQIPQLTASRDLRDDPRFI